MSSRNSAPHRYFKARLLALSRPAVWVPALILALVAAFLLEYTTNPGWLARSNDEDSGPDQSGLGATLSEDDLRAAADIDNLEVLSNDFQPDAAQSAQTQAEGSGNPSAAQPTEPSAGERYLASRDRNNSGGNTLPTPFTTGAADPTNSSSARNGASSGSTPYLFSLGLLDNADQTTAAPSASDTISPLERAIRDQQFRSTASTEPASTAEAASGTTTAADNPQPADVTLLSPSETASSSGNLTSQATTSLPPSVTFIPTSPTMSPPPGTTGYTAPPAYAPVNPSVSGTTVYSNSGVPLSGFAAQPALVPPIPAIGNTFNPVPTITNVGVFGPALSQPSGISSYQAAPQASPFSAPRRQPGRYIGNGEINTFSNP